ncbi:GNAT family N-acetyltransferase [Shouchella lonarensis]|uniref:Acetyltransferase (GNAT) domain-containing protein n=1 Tax=Shouchella lonarensis TaxID=1464122 RepID=A0A1G6MHB1_9BACI|nr:GNAT family N-acetyltransferase [Shouchella lonarensis]SDC54657.1 Acetyltransferase (GNAT) domain-containing protein [Shouchella lonarensis]
MMKENEQRQWQQIHDEVDMLRHHQKGTIVYDYWQSSFTTEKHHIVLAHLQEMTQKKREETSIYIFPSQYTDDWPAQTDEVEWGVDRVKYRLSLASVKKDAPSYPPAYIVREESLLSAEFAALLWRSDPSCPSLDAATKLLIDMESGSYGEVVVCQTLSHKTTRIGFVVLTNMSGVILLAHIVMAPEYGGKGLAKRLLLHATKKAQALGYRQVIASTDETNERSKAVMRAVGFQEVSRDRIAVLRAR